MTSPVPELPAPLALLSSARVQRHEIGPQHRPEPTLPGAARLYPAPPPAPEIPPRPLGDLSRMPIAQVASLAEISLGAGTTWMGAEYRKGMRLLLEELSGFAGATWQERWEAAGLNADGTRFADMFAKEGNRYRRMRSAVWGGFAMRLIQPSLEAMLTIAPKAYVPRFLALAKDPQLDAFAQALERRSVTRASRSAALSSVCQALTVFGVELSDLTAEGVMYFAERKFESGLATAWPVLHEVGIFDSSVPPTMLDARLRGQPTVAELVDRYRPRNTAVRDLLVAYLERRAVSVDFSTVENLGRCLVDLFWKTIEDLNPEQADLRLDPEIVAQWRRRLDVRNDGRPRTLTEPTLMAVRSFYLDVQTWAAAEPERWAHWVAPSPVREEELRRYTAQRREVNERMADRTRERQPLLPVLSEHVTSTWLRLREVLAAARSTELGAVFEAGGEPWQRLAPRRHHARTTVRALRKADSAVVDLAVLEDEAFWQWAVVETLRLAGLRREELCELTHMSIRQYLRPNGEVVPLLVVSPSKSNRERVIPMGAELFHVLAQVVRRHRETHGAVPVCHRYDAHERVWGPELPYLFQRPHSGVPRGLSTAAVRKIVRAAAQALTSTHPRFADIAFTPHDFRRLFATDLVNNGLPIHIGAALLGHMSVETTQGYVAVFEESLVTHYQEFLDRRRAERPRSEYRDPTTEEWADFGEHFDKRRVELGSCARPYGTPCAHEHACVRCPMLSVDPAMLPRLDELEADLAGRRQRAVEEDWRGEVEGIDLTLTFLRSKRQQAQRTIALGLPTLRPPGSNPR